MVTADKTSGAIGNVITLMVGVGIAILVLIFVGALGGNVFEQSEDDIQSIGNNSNINTTFTALNSTAVDLGHEYVHEGSLLIWNSTSDSVSLVMFSIDYTAGEITLINDSSEINNTVLTTTFNYGNLDIQNSIYAAAIGGFSALEDTGGYLPIVILAVIIFLILSMVMGFVSLGNTGGKGAVL